MCFENKTQSKKCDRIAIRYNTLLVLVKKVRLEVKLEGKLEEF